MTDLAAIDRLRRIALAFAQREAVAEGDAQWFAACLAEYEGGAPHGLTLADAFGLKLAPGQAGW